MKYLPFVPAALVVFTCCVRISATPPAKLLNLPSSRSDDSSWIAEPKPCVFPTTSHTVMETPHELHRVFVLRDSSCLWSHELPACPALEQFTQKVRSHVDPVPQDLLKRHIEVFSKVSRERVMKVTENAKMVRDGQAGTIEPIRHLEAYLLCLQAERFPMFESPSEFGAHILKKKKGDDNWLKVYFSSYHLAHGKMRDIVSDSVDKDIEEGWMLVAHLHNHPFFFEREVGDRNWTTAEFIDDIGGTTSPSTGDVHLYRGMVEDWRLPAALITNGFHTLHLKSHELDILNSD